MNENKKKALRKRERIVKALTDLYADPRIIATALGGIEAEDEKEDIESRATTGSGRGSPMVRTEWPPRPQLIIAVGVVIGLGVPLIFPDSIAMQPGAVSLLIVGNVAAAGMVLLLTQGPWRRAAAGLTLTLAFWMGLYSTFTFVGGGARFGQSNG